MATPNLDDYVDVAERIREFREKYPDGSLVAEIIPSPFTGFLAMRAEAFRSPDDPRPGVGHAWEPVPGPTTFTKNSELQNAETAAWGRAIVAALAADTKRIATKQDVENRSDGWADDGTQASQYAAAPPIGTKVQDNPLPDTAPTTAQIDELKKAVAKAASARKQDSRFVRKEVLDSSKVESYERMTATQVGQWTIRLLKEFDASRKAAR